MANVWEMVVVLEANNSLRLVNPPYFDVSSLHIRAPSNSRLASSQAQVKQKTEPLSVLLFWEKSGNGLHWMTLVILPFMNQSQRTREYSAPVTSLRNTYSLKTNVVLVSAWTEASGGLVSEGKYGFCHQNLRNWMLDRGKIITVFCKDGTARCLILEHPSWNAVIKHT